MNDVKKTVLWKVSVTWWCGCDAPTKARGQHLKVGNSVLSKCGTCSKVILGKSKQKGVGK